MSESVHWAFLRNGRFTAYCNGSEQAIVTWSNELLTCQKCRTRKVVLRIVRSDVAIIRMPVECRICDAVAEPGEELTCGHYQIPGYLRRG